MTAAREALRDRRELAMLDSPSVRHMADVLAERCREASWVRTTVASLDRFVSLTQEADLEALLERARCDSRAASAALEAFARVLGRYEKSQIAALAMAPKLWFALNGVPVPWRPLVARATAAPQYGKASPVDRLVLLALVGSGLQRSELLRVRIGDLGRLGAAGELIADVDADPLAVRFVQQRGGAERITFLSDQARDAVHVELARRTAAGEAVTPNAPLVAAALGRRATRATVARSSRRNMALIEAGNSVNVELCRETGRFFRTWGLPGARFDRRAAAAGGEQT